MKRDLTISVVIPCYNAAPFLRQTLDSVLSQTHPAFEAIVIDDGSMDESAEIAESYGAPIRVIRQENQGESAARNRGMDEARGNWIALLDADDLWVPHKLERQIEVLKTTSEKVACVYSDFLLFGSVRREVRSRPMWPVESERRVRMLTDPWIAPGTMLYPTELGRKVRFPRDIVHGEDKMFPMKLFDHGAFIHIPEPLLEYRKHPGQQTALSRHGYRVVESVWNWSKDHPEEFNHEENKILRKRLAALLVSWHDTAYWTNDWEIVESARALYLELMPDTEQSPPLFFRESPTWMMRSAHALWNSLLGAVPGGVRSKIWRASRAAVNKVKRGGA